MHKDASKLRKLFARKTANAKRAHCSCTSYNVFHVKRPKNYDVKKPQHPCSCWVQL